MRKWMTVIIVLVLGTLVFAQERDVQNGKGPHPLAAAYILERVACANAHEAASIVFGEYSVDLFEGEYYKIHTDFETQELGDGTRGYIFSPPGVSGQWAYRPNYHFVMEGDKLRLIFDGEGDSSRYLWNGPRYNGRYLIERGRRADTFGGIRDETITLAYRAEYFFWTGARYAGFLTVTEVLEAKDPRKKGVTRIWCEKEKEAFLNARVTWEHKVGRFDVLGKICKRHSTNMADVISQNHIEDPSVLRIGQLLTYDSRKTKSGKHDMDALMATW